MAYNNRGAIYHNFKDYQKAIADFTQAIRLDPNLANAYYNRGLAYKDLQQYKKAIENFNQAAKLYQQQKNNYWYQRSHGQLKLLQLR